MMRTVTQISSGLIFSWFESGNAAEVHTSKLTSQLLSSLLFASYGRADTILSAGLMNSSLEDPQPDKSATGAAEEEEAAFYF